MADAAVAQPRRGRPHARRAGEEQRYLTAAKVGDLADAIAPRYRAMVLVASYGGLRFGELVAPIDRPNAR